MRSHQGKGHLKEVFREPLKLIDSEKAYSYLEATSEENVRIYQKYGYEVVDTFTLGICTKVWCMLRKPM
ncbi:hypothetical protein HK099_005065 [Clydaea vesicula]|uniref:N-acetyltransferase domain-containing protein n=1 Tax=Clydaea vesicula TaxID=447962 RepID=A0AAD5XYG2_9FUNG|nr:hypothetical protein HK099_005065 [Clydaea vesicula]